MQDVLIVGGGTAGLTAAIYARRAGLSCTVFEGGTPGGQIVTSPEVDNYPAMPKVSGFDYAMALLKQVQELDAEIIYESVISAELGGKTKRLCTANGEYEGKSVIIANGVLRRKLGCKGESEFEGKGVSYCATCDGAFFREKAVAVVGGGNTAFEDAEYLAGICSKVYIIHRSDKFRASDALKKAVLENKNVTVLTNSEVSEISGESSVTSLTVRSRANGSEAKIAVSAVFVAVGMVPDNSIFSATVKLDGQGYIIAGENCLTETEGVFVAGDTREKELRQLVTAASDGAVAAMGAFKYIKNNL